MTPQEFETLEHPLRGIDVLLDAFARKTKGKFVKNYHNVPSRRIDWIDASEITKTILISSAFVDRYELGNVRRFICYVFAIFATKDYVALDDPGRIELSNPRPRRKWWHKKIAELNELPTGEHEVMQLLEGAHEELKGVEEANLMPVS